MDELRKKQKLKKRLYSLPALILLAGITFLFIRGTYIVFEKKAESEQYVQALEKKSEDLQEEQAVLTQNIESLKTEEGIEKEVKEKYNVAKEGEHVVILVDRQATSTESASSSRAWYQKIWDAILSAL